MPQYYQCYSNETVPIISAGETVQYVGMIRVLGKAQSGACTGIALTVGSHPYTCTECNALVHCKSSTLNHKLNHSTKLKHLRSDPTCAKKGVFHKFCSSEQLQVALQIRKTNEKINQEKLVSVSKVHQKL